MWHHLKFGNFGEQINRDSGKKVNLFLRTLHQSYPVTSSRMPIIIYLQIMILNVWKFPSSQNEVSKLFNDLLYPNLVEVSVTTVTLSSCMRYYPQNEPSD